MSADHVAADARDARQQQQKRDRAAAFRVGARLRREGATYEDMCEAISTDATTADWYFEKGAPNGGRELRRIWDKAGEDGEQGKRRRNTLALVSFITDQEEWQDTLAINLLTETIEIAMHLPSTTRCEQRPLVDADVLEAMLYFQARLPQGDQRCGARCAHGDRKPQQLSSGAGLFERLKVGRRWPCAPAVLGLLQS